MLQTVLNQCLKNKTIGCYYYFCCYHCLLCCCCYSTIAIFIVVVIIGLDFVNGNGAVPIHNAARYKTTTIIVIIIVVVDKIW